MTGIVVLIILLVVALIVLCSNIIIVPESQSYVVERLGVFCGVWERGIHFKTPLIERIVKRVSLKEQVADFQPQAVITKDNVTMQIDTVVYLKYSNPKLLAYGVENPIRAVENLTATTLRNIIGEMELDQTLTSRDIINSKMRTILDDATDPWGIKITRVELKNIMPPRDIQESMEKQMRAERERREAILQAEGQKQSQILVAQGEKESAILRAEAKKQSAILEAEADKVARITRAEGEAEAILKVQEATADGLRKIKEVGVDEGTIRLRSLETLQAMADGQATKIIIPSKLQGLAGTLAGLKETLDDDKKFLNNYNNKK